MREQTSKLVGILSVVPIFLLFASCAKERITSPVSLSEAIRTLPSRAVSGMTRAGREEYLEAKPGDYIEESRRTLLANDNPYIGGDADSMLFLRLFEGDDGHTIAAAYSARPFNDDRELHKKNAFVFHLVSGEWVDITESVMPEEVLRSWWFRFNEEGEGVPCGRYEPYQRRDNEGTALSFGPAEGMLIWREGRFRFEHR